MTVGQVIQHFAFERVNQWLNQFPKKEGRAKMFLGILISEKEYLAFPLHFTSDVYFDYTPIYHVSLN